MTCKNLLAALLLLCQTSPAQEPRYDYMLFSNSRMAGNYYFSEGKSAGNAQLKQEKGRLPVTTEQIYSPGNALLLDYVNGSVGRWEARIRKAPVRGQDFFKTAQQLSVFFYLEPSGTATQALPSIQLLKQDGSKTKAVRIPRLQPGKWQRITFPLSAFADQQVKESVQVQGILFSQQGRPGAAHRLFVDEIGFLPNDSAAQISSPAPVPAAKGYAKHIDLSWPVVTDAAVKYVQISRSADGKTFSPIGIQSPFINRYTDFTGETGRTWYYRISLIDQLYRESASSPVAKAATRSMTDEELMTMVQEAGFRYYWEAAEPTSGLARENMLGRHQMIASGASGFGMMALLVGVERGFITRSEAADRFVRIVNFLGQAQTFHGAYPHFIDGPTGRVETFFGPRDNGGDLVETSFLMQGLLAARAYFNQTADPKELLIRDKITGIWQRVDWAWYRRYPDSKFLYWHWSPDQGWIINHRLIGWNETMITYLLAIASPSYSVPAGLYYSGWANQDSIGQQYRSAWGGTKDGSMYSNGNTYFGIPLEVGVSNGGPLFFTHYSYLGYDPHAITDKYTNYFRNNQAIARINWMYCRQNPGGYKGYSDSCWGLTASDGPEHYAADEPVLRQDHGKIAPTGAISSFPYTPAEAMKALRHYYNDYGQFLWGEYGFRDAFNLSENWCSEIFMGLNQAPITVMIENYRTGLLWKLFMSDRDVQNGLQLLNAATAEELKRKG
ncbi:MAG: glucoamylase family protein [Chitinophagaceae bacterium]